MHMKGLPVLFYFFPLVGLVEVPLSSSLRCKEREVGQSLAPGKHLPP